MDVNRLFRGGADVLRSGWQTWTAFGISCVIAVIDSFRMGSLASPVWYSVTTTALVAIVVGVRRAQIEKHKLLRDAIRRVNSRLSDFEKFTWGDQRNSIFWNSVFSEQSNRPPTVWEWYKGEKESNIGFELTKLKEELLRAQQQADMGVVTSAFGHLCFTARGLGAFIQRFGQYFKQKRGGFSGRTKLALGTTTKS